MVPVALTIAGSDPSGGAGLAADLKTFHQHGIYGAAVVTLLTVQNTTGVRRVEVLDGSLVAEQIDAVVEDLPVEAAKTGALGSAEVLEAVADRAARFAFPLVVDPVMVSKHGSPLLDASAVEVLVRRLVPRAALLTPNTVEAAALTGRDVTTVDEAIDAARALTDLGARAVLIKGGHLAGDAEDVLFVGGEIHRLVAARVHTDQGHGTGCTLSAAITARLALGDDLVQAVTASKRWLTAALARAPGLGRGIGPVDHLTPVDDLPTGR